MRRLTPRRLNRKVKLIEAREDTMADSANGLRRWLGDLPALDTPGGAALAVLTAAVAVGMALIHIIQALDFTLSSGQFKSIHVNLGAILVFLLLAGRAPAEQRWRRRLYILAAAVAAIPLIYIHVQHDEIVETRVLFPSEADHWVAILMILTVFAAAWREWGAIIPALALAGLLYGYFGYLMPSGFFFHSGISVERLISYTSIPSFGGMLGGLTEESARTIFMFMLFAGVLKETGGTSLIMKLSFAAVGHMRAGPAQVAVVSSALFGMISGSTVANVAAQGPYTIPTMRRCGFSAEFAGAIEAVSSTGGQITPPVLGLTAFLIVGLTGIPYVEVMVATVFPALIFYAYLMLNIHIEAIKRGIAAMPDMRLDDGSRARSYERPSGAARAPSHPRRDRAAVCAVVDRHAYRPCRALSEPPDASGRGGQADDQAAGWRGQWNHCAPRADP